jgi:hypothetical protein
LLFGGRALFRFDAASAPSKQTASRRKEWLSKKNMSNAGSMPHSTRNDEGERHCSSLSRCPEDKPKGIIYWLKSKKD